MAEDPRIEGASAAPEAPERAPVEPMTGIAGRTQNRELLARVRAAIAASCASQAESRSLLARAAELVGGSQRQRTESAALRAELQASVAAYVRTLRSGGLAAERVVVLVKNVVRESTSEMLDVGEARDLMEEVVRWSIEVYYAA